MRLLRLIVAGLIGLAAMLAVAFAALVVFLTGLVGLVAQVFRGKAGSPPPVRPPAPGSRTDLRTDDVIDVVTTKVPRDEDGPGN